MGRKVKKNKVKSRVKAKAKKKVKKQVLKKKQKTKPAKKVKKNRIPAKNKVISKPATKFLVALAQINTSVGDINSNTNKIIATIQKAKEKGAELVVFPELTITGYPPKDLLYRNDFVDMNMQKFIEIVNSCRGISAIFGFVNKNNGVLYNSVAVVKDQKILCIQNKMHLSNYDKKYFAEGNMGDIIQLGNKRIGVVLCTKIIEEHSHIEQLVDKGVDFIMAVSASPYALRIPQEREQAGTLIAKKFGIPVLFCNSVGASDDLIFDGSSFLVDKKGLIAMRAKRFAEDILLFDANMPGKTFTPSTNQAGEVFDALTLGIRDYFAKTGFTKAVIGISGGLDSAVTAALAVRAIGAENVIGLHLPSKITSKDSILDAKRLCSSLKITHKVIKIDPIVQPTVRALGLKYEKNKIDLTEQNIQARARAQILLSYANKENALVLGTINKSALAVGYCSVYGDTVGALAPLGDLWKIQVQSLAEFINAWYKKKHKTYAIPATIMKKKPSAELRPGQKDSDDIPEYDVLDKILQFYVGHKKDIHQIGKTGIDKELVRKIALLVHRNEFKRQQLPLCLKVSNSYFGELPVVSGWRG
ncbi:NAD+ synthase [Candidatus Woesearchaeota archaeon CG10_big_fil_rev_8_21_14_0_10_34_8]|nr:MAG: NAD+ synthase [Candidatus Woesearchaeota archaeon CG10_big_fil_rev_8_21_14_0_10_34_8]